ncbi:hypothetical protein [Vibrio cincinnatiensis]|uniref:hypothetical protein n=1 Tax=Vibrio cincinnatiensis TaxID=675 RepID=UPI001E5F4119|nr:hypothetical protein [Vibrio cincinnatiensis]
MMMLLMPILIPMLTAAISMIIWRHRKLQRWLSVFSSSAVLITALILFHDVYLNGIQVVYLGGGKLHLEFRWWPISSPQFW